MSSTEFIRLINRLEAFKKELRHKISFNQGQLEFADDMINQLKKAQENVQQQEKELSAREEDRKKLRGVKTPKGENV